MLIIVILGLSDAMPDFKLPDSNVPESGMSPDDFRWMRVALSEARHAAERGEVPVGAIVVFDNDIVGVGSNRREALQDPTGHAELIAIQEASRTLGTWRLINATLYVTLEPCPMCAGAMVNSRLSRCVFGAFDPKAGAARSLFSILDDPRLNHRMNVSSGCLQDESAQLLSHFFSAIRNGRGPQKPRLS